MLYNIIIFTTEETLIYVFDKNHVDRQT